MADPLGEAFRIHRLQAEGYRLTPIRKAAKYHARSLELYSDVDRAAEIIRSRSPQWWLELSQSVPNGGDRRSIYAGAKTAPIRVPAQMKDLFLTLAKKASSDPEILKKLKGLT
jgi:hypothetical protein